MANRKLGRPTDQRMAMLRNQVTNLIWYGKIETTLARGKEVQSMAEHLITIAMRQCDNTVEVTKKHMNDKKQIEMLTVQNDSPARLAARRQVMRYLYDIPLTQNEDEERDDFKKRQAEPADAQIPYLSNSNNNSEPFTSLKLTFAFPGNLFIKSPFTLILSISFLTLFI